MHTVVDRLKFIRNKVNEITIKKQLKTSPTIIAVCKTFPISSIIPLLDTGHIHYGENKIQEAEKKWLGIKKKYNNLQLHMLGRLQSNKVKKAVLLFDYIHSLDNEKLAIKISECEKNLNKKTKIFIQVNIADEISKVGILSKDLHNFYIYCIKKLSLNIIGLMCLPPFNSDSNKYFQMLNKTSTTLNIKELSMGMSGDYEQAILNGSTFLRLGTAIFGERNT